MQKENTELNFQQFTEEVKAGMQDLYPDADIIVMPTEKNNGLVLTGLAICEPGRRVSPTIYLNNVYQFYKQGEPWDEVLSEIEGVYKKGRLEHEPDIPDIMDFEAVKGLICCRLVNREHNKERLKKMPHRDFLDLAVVYYIPVEIDMDGEGSSGSITVMDSHTEKWTVDSDTLFSTALANTERLFPSELQSMGKILQDLCPELSIQETGMHVLRNNGSSGGAAALLNEKILREFGERHGDFYIFPSSVYEVILHPVATPEMVLEKDDLSSVVRDINRAQVAPDEVLSDNAYLYHADTGKIEILP